VRDFAQAWDVLCLADMPNLGLWGEGEHDDAMVTFITTLHHLGYRGDYSLAVFNADYRQMPATSVSWQARSAALWLGQDVLQRSVPLPNQIRLKHEVRRAVQGQLDGNSA
jgi:hypothetical protein